MPVCLAFPTECVQALQMLLEARPVAVACAAAHASVPLVHECFAAAHHLLSLSNPLAGEAAGTDAEEGRPVRHTTSQGKRDGHRLYTQAHQASPSRLTKHHGGA